MTKLEELQDDLKTAEIYRPTQYEIISALVMAYSQMENIAHQLKEVYERETRYHQLSRELEILQSQPIPDEPSRFVKTTKRKKTK